jgi:hypothetical protein
LAGCYEHGDELSHSSPRVSQSVSDEIKKMSRECIIYTGSMRNVYKISVGKP